MSTKRFDTARMGSGVPPSGSRVARVPSPKKATASRRSTRSRKFSDTIADYEPVHGTWWRFDKWLWRAFGADLIGPPQVFPGTKLTYRERDESERNRRMVGYEAMERIRKWCERYAPEIKILSADDAVHAGSMILLIPHPSHGITMMYIPQCTDVQNQLFLYKGCRDGLVGALTDMGGVYSAIGIGAKPTKEAVLRTGAKRSGAKPGPKASPKKKR